MNDAQPAFPSRNGAVDWVSALAEHRRWLRTVVYSRIGDGHAVEEVVQEVTLAVVRNPPHVEPDRVQAWLYRVAVRQCLLWRRKLGRDKRRTKHWAETRRQLAETNGHTPDPLKWLLADEERDLIRQALDQLKPRDRELLLLKYTENWTCRELGDRLGIKTTTVETRLDRARRRLRAALARFDITGDHQ